MSDDGMAFNEIFIAASVAALATSIGALIVLPFKKISRKIYPALIAFSAGIMTFSAAEMLGESNESGGFLAVFVGFLAGLIVILISERLLPHVHHFVRKKELTSEKRKTALIVGTVTLHNVPEGFAIASAFAGSTPLGWLVATAIAIQDIPEGFLISGPLACYGMEHKRCIKYGVLSGVVEFAAAIIGFTFLTFVSILIPFGLSFSAGAMFYVVFAELLPDSFRNGFERMAAVSFISGLALAYAIATVMGF